MSIGTILREDDFVIGQLITVYGDKVEEKKQNGVIRSNNPDFVMGFLPQKNKEDYSVLKGRVLCIKAINLPYLVLTAFDFEDINKDQTFPIDVRQCFFMEVTEEYCQAIFSPVRFKEVEDFSNYTKLQSSADII